MITIIPLFDEMDEIDHVRAVLLAGLTRKGDRGYHWPWKCHNGDGNGE